MRKSLGIYIHIPFCEKKCAYCDFYSVRNTEETAEAYVEALFREIKKWGGLLDRPIDTIYIGGGTPSLLEEKISDIINCVKNSFSVASDAEITCELNPNASEAFLRAAYESGVNRLSVGAQSGNNNRLIKLGRRHTVSDTEKIVQKAREIGFENISLDLMIALPESNIGTLKEDIDFIASLSPEHISSYILKIEEKTRFYNDKSLILPGEDEIAEQYLYMCDCLEKLGYGQYEVSNFSKAGRQSRHNLRYWNCLEYIGIGPAAHSFLEGKRFYYPRDIKSFIENPATVPDGEGGSAVERLMLALRLNSGVDLSEYINPLSQSLIFELRMLQKADLIIKSGTHISLTPKGMLVSNAVISDLTELIYENI